MYHDNMGSLRLMGNQVMILIVLYTRNEINEYEKGGGVARRADSLDKISVCTCVFRFF